MIGNSVYEKTLKIEDYVKRLEDEMKKIDAFKRELPLCLLLVNDAITALREESTQSKKPIVEPVFEESIPLKKSSLKDDKVEMNKDNDSREKMNWMSSVQLWNSDPQNPNTDIHNSKQSSKSEPKKEEITQCHMIHFNLVNPGIWEKAFSPFKGCSVFPVKVDRKEDKDDLPVLTLPTPGIKNLEDTMINGLSSKPSDNSVTSSIIVSYRSNIHIASQLQQQQNARKQRRCWSPELHRRFIDALKQLGGSQAATPKQIRELMQVDGLTNDEVKSHLQKYRLHIRKLSDTQTPSTSESVVLGNIWLPQDQYGESSKQSSSQSGSPHCPLQLGGSSRGTSMTVGDSMEEEDDERSESHSWKVQMSRKIDV
ncbi:myb family transcription factor efm [Nicotiana attenuata]|uniref:Myb family transcription factor efm n=1 Tax=Nicotiana attenuata TaxID=49451 RepID=A0A314KKD3_NICAT|nr:myb family transcription factor efm [Nicotiana attenuata]